MSSRIDLRCVKDPDEVLDYSVDWSKVLDSDTISASDWDIPAGLTEGANSYTTTTATVWLSSGVDNADYICVNRVDTAGGRTLEASIMVQVRSTVSGSSGGDLLTPPISGLDTGGVVFGQSSEAVKASANFSFVDGTGITLGNS